MATTYPTMVVAGTNSGAGKTSVTSALVPALKMRGLKVQAFKVGPDYLDPTHLAVPTGRPCYNVDGWMMGRDYVRRLFLTQASSADIAVIEGVTGLFDGRRFDMVGLVPWWTRMLGRLKSLGYEEVTFTTDSLFGRCGDKLRGHESHYSELIDHPTDKPNDQAVYKVKRMRSDSLDHEGFQCGHVLASYVHTHFASREQAVKHFVAVCSRQE